MAEQWQSSGRAVAEQWQCSGSAVVVHGINNKLEVEQGRMRGACEKRASEYRNL